MGFRWAHKNTQKSLRAACVENGGDFRAPQGPGEGCYVEVGLLLLLPWALARTDLPNSVMCLNIPGFAP